MRYVPHRLLTGLLLAVAFVALSASRASAGECDLYAANSYCLFTDNSLFQVAGPHPTGTGVIDSFLRVQQNGSEQGFNTSFRGSGPDKGIICDPSVACDDKTDPNYTENLLTSAVPIVTVNGIQYRQFFLDINEPAALNNGKNYLTLDQIEIYQSNTADLNGHSSTAISAGTAGSLTGATKIWDMDPAVYNATQNGAYGQNGLTSPLPSGDNWINLDYVLVGGGSGWGDMVMYIPNSLFNANTKYVYLYSQFGCIGDCGKTKYGSVWTNQYPSQAGFEEWWVKNANGGSNDGSSPVPEPGTFVLLGTGIVAAIRSRRKAVKR